MENIKAFCRKQTQKVNEVRGSSDCTVDNLLDEELRPKIEKIRKYSERFLNSSKKMELSFETLVFTLSDIKESLCHENFAEENSYKDELRQADIAHVHIGKKFSEAVQQIQKELKDPLNGILKDCKDLNSLMEERKQKRLEYDFFRHKVASLTQNPPKDASRIPRNKAILDGHSKSYSESTNLCRSAAERLLNRWRGVTQQFIRSYYSLFSSYLLECGNSSRLILHTKNESCTSTEKDSIKKHIPIEDVPHTAAHSDIHTSSASNHDQKKSEQDSVGENNVHKTKTEYEDDPFMS